jgi:hypothetical protein
MSNSSWLARDTRHVHSTALFDQRELEVLRLVSHARIVDFLARHEFEQSRLAVLGNFMRTLQSGDNLARFLDPFRPAT